MRTTKELLQIMLANGHMFDYGLCKLSSRLRKAGIITSDEEDLLDNYVYENAPKREGSVYSWPEGLWEPRKDFIIHHIKKLRK